MVLWTLTVAVATVSADVDTNGRVDTNGCYNALYVIECTLFGFRALSSNFGKRPMAKFGEIY